MSHSQVTAIRKINVIQTLELMGWIDSHLDSYKSAAVANEALFDGWEIQVADQKRGWCKPYLKQLILPTWVMLSSKKGYIDYYLSHELAHIKSLGHGPEFMAAFKLICAAENQHYEVEYKPKAAMAAGITPSDF